MINIKQLFHALALNQHQSFRKAAQAVYLSHPAFSRSISNLEQLLGVRLFDRLSSGVEPTVHGKVLLKRAREILESIEELEREIKFLDGLEKGELSVSMGGLSAEITGLKAVGRIIDKYPNLQVKVTKRDVKNMSKAILERTVDIGLIETSTIEHDDKFDVETIGHHRVLLFCRMGHPLTRKARLSFDDMTPYPLVMTILPERITPYVPDILLPSEVEGFFRPDIVVEDISSACEIVAESDAYGVACPVMLEADLYKGKFIALPLWDEFMRVHYGFISKRGRTLSPASQKFKQEVIDIDADIEFRNEELVKNILKGSILCKQNKLP